MLRYDIVLLLIALIPFGAAVLYRLAIVPRRSRNISDLLQLALERSVPEQMSEQHAYLQRGTVRVRDDFESQYTVRLLLPSAFLSFLYIVAIPLSFSRVLQCHDCNNWLLNMPRCFPAIPSFDFLLYAILGAYSFNLGVLVRRTFLADVTEHVYWGAINRLLLTCGLALAVHGVRETIALSPALYFVIAFTPSIFLTQLRKLASKVFQEDGKSATEFPLQMVQGIDVWKEQRLQEEGIETVQNLATADILTLAVKTHYPLRTLIDWIDQAILIQRLPEKIQLLRAAGFSVSAVDFAWMSPSNNNGSKNLASLVANATALNAEVVAVAMDSMLQDSYVQILLALWQNEGRDDGHPSSA